MADKGEGRRSRLAINAIDPVSGQSYEIFISYERMQAVARRSMGQAKECGFIIPYILQNPTAVFEGLRRDTDEDRQAAGWRCYCGVPRVSYAQDGTEGRPYRNQVFLVFINEDRVAYNWRWEKADRDDPLLPDGHAVRFRTRLS